MDIEIKVFYATVLLLSGCLPVATLHPAYTEETAVFEEKLLGTWLEEDYAKWQFVRIPDDQNNYYLRLEDQEGKKGYFEAHLCKIDNSLILDVIPAAHPCGEVDTEDMLLPYNAFFVQSLHTFLKIELADPNLKIAITDQDKFEKLLEDSPGSLEYTKTKDRLIITASSNHIQKFIAEHINDERLFTEPSTLQRQEAKAEKQADPNEQ